MTKYKHLTLSDRNDIQIGLERGESYPYARYSP
ncbi:helix-turn-helix domain-containing protein [Streptococcus marmotae]